MPSLRSKIAISYVVSAIVVVAFGMFAYSDLRYLEQRIEAGAAVTDFMENSLEMRRYEKNYFLYGEPANLNAALTHAERAQADLEDSRAAFVNVTAGKELKELEQSLQLYHALLKQYAEANPAERELLEQKIRAYGQRISRTAEEMSLRQSRAMAESIKLSSQALMVSLAILVVLGILGGQILSRWVVRPLRQLEDSLTPIAEGRYNKLEVPTRDREIVSFTKAFNDMLKQLRARQRQLLHSEKLASLGVLVSGVAHELNNPLSNISSSCQLLIEELDSADRETLLGWLGQIDSESERARQIVRALLDYSRQRDFVTERVALEQVLRKSLFLLRSQLKEAGAVELEVSTDVEVSADLQRLQQVFINLIKNAVDAGGPGTHITVSARCTRWQDSAPPPEAHLVGDPSAFIREQRRLALVTVEDDGPGIPPEVLPKVFDPFFTTRDIGHGTGLGLYVVEEIIQDHGGCIAVESTPGLGTRFSIWLPCAVEETP